MHEISTCFFPSPLNKNLSKKNDLEIKIFAIFYYMPSWRILAEIIISIESIIDPSVWQIILEKSHDIFTFELDFFEVKNFHFQKVPLEPLI